MTDAEIIENGRSLFLSAQNLRRSAPDLDALLDSLWEVVEAEYFGPIEDLGDEDSDDHGWISTGYAYNAAVLARGKKGKPLKQPIGSPTFIVRLCSTGEVEDESAHWPWLDQACLIVGWHGSDTPDDYWEIGNFEPTDENVANIAHAGSGLWAWAPDGEYYSHFFAIPIFALRNEHDLKKYALRPLKALFDSGDPVAAAPDVLKDIPALQPPTR